MSNKSAKKTEPARACLPIVCFFCTNVKLKILSVAKMSVFNGINHFALQGQEVFNTYGELANWQLLHMYGFATPSSSNHFDAVSGSHLQLTSFCCRFATWNSLYSVVCGWLGSRVVSVLESGTEGPGFKLQS